MVRRAANANSLFLAKHVANANPHNYGGFDMV